MVNSIDEFVLEFKKIRERGWIKTHRSGPTGIGKTLEDLLGIVENNIIGPDFCEYELKSGRLNTGAMLTMFTLAPKPPKSNTYLLNKYGYSSSAYDNEMKVLHATLTASRFVGISGTGRSLRIICDPEKLSIASDIEVENVYWTRDNLRKAFSKKYSNKFLYVKAQSRGKGVNEEFLFTEAEIVSGFDYDSVMALLEKGKVYVDLRIGQYSDGRTHDHGTAFRIRKQDEILLFHDRESVV